MSFDGQVSSESTSLDVLVELFIDMNVFLAWKGVLPIYLSEVSLFVL